MEKMKLVLVGNGMAGVRTLEELLKIAPDLYDITIFGAEPHPNYNRILLSPVLAGEQTLEQMLSGDMNASPAARKKRHEACEYCDYKSVCRFDPKKPGCRIASSLMTGRSR